MRFGPDGWIYFTERPGWFSKLDPETGEKVRLLTEHKSIFWHEAGMMGFDFHPDFPDSPFIYVADTYGDKEGDFEYGLFRYRYTGDALVERTQIFGPALALYSHVGSRVIIRDRKIYFSIGEVWQFEIAQDAFHANGKINRINLDGSIPDDNPFLGSPAWSTGHRNPQGLDFAPNGTLYSSEHGDHNDDEINLIEKGRNYGWPIIQGYCDSASDHPNCEDLFIREPLAAFTPTLAVGDIAYFDHASFPEWRHSLLLATLKDESLHQFKLSEDGSTILDHQRYHLVDSDGELYGRLRSVCLSNDGRIYISTGNGYARENLPDKIFELIRTGVEPSEVVLKAPADQESISSSESDLSWQQSFHNASYEIQLSTSENFGLPILTKKQALGTDLRVSMLKPDTRYFWRVRELVSSGPWSEIRSFKTAASLVTQPEMPAIGPSFDVISHTRTIGLIARSSALDAEVEIIDVLGRLLDKAQIVHLPLGTEKFIGTFEPGVYFVRVTTALGTRTRRVLVR